MTTARRQQVCLEATPYYHCMTRCVRRAYLCGEDHATGKSFDHRKQWLVDRIKEISAVFAIDVCAYSAMSNHYHLIVYIDKETALGWSDDEVIERWYTLYSGHRLVDRYQAGEKLSKAELKVMQELVDTWRERLYDLSWFMRNLNEPIARKANEEEGCKGRFWEGRYRSQALLDEAALLSCMTYVDLNPIRAGIAETPETSDFTSIKARIEAQAEHASESIQPLRTPAGLRPFAGDESLEPAEPGLPFHLLDYLELVDWTGRAIRDDKRGAIPSHLASILERLSLNQDNWLTTVKYFGHRFPKVMGTLDNIKDYAAKVGQAWVRGQSCCASAYRMKPA